MNIRLGYACISKTLDITSSHTITYTNYEKTRNKEEYKYKKNHHLNIIKRSYLYNKIYEILLSKLFYSIVNNHDENNFLINS